jgi:FixJ family two-component response regulator
MASAAVTASFQQPALSRCVWLVDDDRRVLHAVTRIFRAAGYAVRTFASGELVLAESHHAAADCIVLELCMPGMTGLEVQQALVRSGNRAPVIFISAHPDVASSVQAMKAGAVDFLTKPFDPSELLTAVQAALARTRLSSAAQAERAGVARLFSHLTPRERQVLEQLLRGKRNKEIARALGASEKTIKVHRSRLQQKMGVRSLAELVSCIERAGLRECLMQRRIV